MIHTTSDPKTLQSKLNSIRQDAAGGSTKQGKGGGICWTGLWAVWEIPLRSMSKTFCLFESRAVISLLLCGTALWIIELEEIVLRKGLHEACGNRSIIIRLCAAEINILFD